jgi:hypothetical protein
MSDRVSQIVLLCEDQRQQQLVFAYLRSSRKNPERLVRPRVASQERHDGNIGWVLDEFPKELHACRQRQKKAQTLLVVFIDADDLSPDARRRQLLDRLKKLDMQSLTDEDPVALLIAKRHVETWICALHGEGVSEDDDCKAKMKFTREAIRAAADALYAWRRKNASPGSTCVPSLTAALSEWRKIG